MREARWPGQFMVTWAVRMQSIGKPSTYYLIHIWFSFCGLKDEEKEGVLTVPYENNNKTHAIKI